MPEPTCSEDPASGDAFVAGRRVDVAHHGLLVFFTLIWGSNFVLAEIALQELAAISFSVARFVAAAGVLLIVLYLRGRATGPRWLGLFPVLHRADWPRLLVVSLLGATMAPWLGIEGLHLTSSGRAALWLAICPAVSAGLGFLLRTERLNRIGLIGLVVAAAGTIGLALDGMAPGRNAWQGDALLFLGICCTAAELHLIKPLAIAYGATSVVAARTAIGGMLYVAIALPSIAAQPWLSLSAWTWIAILAGGAIGVGVGQWIKVRALDTLGPTRVVLYGNLVPPATLFLAWLILGTEPTAVEIGAGVTIIAGAICLQLGDPHRPKELSVAS
ncbi:MAG: DMT family transporter [Rhodothermales bacterium]